MTLIVNGCVVTDHWVRLADEAPLPDGGHVIVSFARWQAEKSIFCGSDLVCGVWLDSHQSSELLCDDLDSLDLVALNFPAFADGRGFTSGRILRERYGFRGQIRATGVFILDQIDLLRRCGFDAFDTEKPEVIRGIMRNAPAQVRVYYQPGQDAQDEIVSVLRRRLLHGV